MQYFRAKQSLWFFSALLWLDTTYIDEKCQDFFVCVCVLIETELYHFPNSFSFSSLSQPPCPQSLPYPLLHYLCLTSPFLVQLLFFCDICRKERLLW